MISFDIFFEEISISYTTFTAFVVFDVIDWKITFSGIFSDDLQDMRAQPE
jgi:hypothetical protein